MYGVIESRPAPVPTRGPWVWLRKNLFSSPFNTVLTVVTGIIAVFVVYNVAMFVFVDASWGQVWANMKLFGVYRYPFDLLWRPLAIAAVLLLVPRTATLGAVLYFPIILNIFVVTAAIGFQGTWAITGLMLLACTYLLCWDYDRFKALLPTRRPRSGRFGTREYGVQATAGALAGLIGFGILLLGNLGNARAETLPFFVVMVGGGAVLGLAAAWHLRRMPEQTAPEA